MHDINSADANWGHQQQNFSADVSGRGELFSTSNPTVFGQLKPDAKFHNPTITPAGRKVSREKKKENCR